MATKLILSNPVATIHSATGSNKWHTITLPDLDVSQYSAIRVVADVRKDSPSTIQIIINVLIEDGSNWDPYAPLDTIILGWIFNDTPTNITKAYLVPGQKISIQVRASQPPQPSNEPQANTYDLFIFGTDGCCNEKA
jgi:archaellum component FlaF (FlaF/FlaG flagellin family)